MGFGYNQSLSLDIKTIGGVISKTVVRIASATGIGYRHYWRMRFYNKLAYALNYEVWQESS